MELLAKALFPAEHNDCDQFLRHKMSLISPTHLIANGIPCFTTVHREREFMITFPRAYHAGFNHGYNIAESTNFASERWIDYGKAAKACMCRTDTVRINMDIFVKKYQRDQWVDPEPAPVPETEAGCRIVLRLNFGRADSASKRVCLTDEARALRESERSSKSEEREMKQLMKEAHRQALTSRREQEERALKLQRRLEEKQAKVR